MEIHDEIYVHIPVHHETVQLCEVKTFKALHYYSSVQVERFEIWGGDGRSIKLEKNKLEEDKRKSAWKILHAIVEPGKEKKAAYVIHSIQGYLDTYLSDKATGSQRYWSGYYKTRFKSK